MDLEIRPEPMPEERAALEAALRALEEEARAGSSAWWLAGLAENVNGRDEGPADTPDSS